MQAPRRVLIRASLRCSQAPPATAISAISGAGAQQTGVTATCASGGAGMLVTTSLTNPPGLTPGQQYTLSGYTTSRQRVDQHDADTRNVELPGSGPYSVIGTVAGSCPTISSTGNVLSGSGGSMTWPTISTALPFQYGGTGITAKNGQHFCSVIGEYSDD